ncbi:PREDICTED: uncharacterized protein LOC104822000 isoform X2 [Tarenaya hassleriana]|uniref:uncharacterized protein LOC104822000 isoform X2 n=1 Tax=Tarenaya hassleriana TaxID=28532 RepID=UPI00053C9019|nr:PREDICTED: uncharacterized protein LOC104822000 isoform X2 [Tarenaya hassleriana]
MAKKGAGCEEWRSDDLEIISIGAVYTGSWDKKYWSSSRGKDRYPYPVGYKAVRTHNGNTYKMEIQEGPKGPVFLIRHSTESWFGQTPDIAWGKFQKTGFSHLKVWHGKRFTCKMDGVEFFGFKNPLVQRLLRELVGNTFGARENRFLVPSSSNGASKILDDDENPVTYAYPSFLPYLDKSVPRKKRSRRSEIACQKSLGGNNHKRPRPRDLLSDGEITNSVPMPSCSIKGETDRFGLRGIEIPPERLHLDCAPIEDPCISIETPPHVKVVVPLQEIDELPDRCKSKPVSNFCEELHRLQDTDDVMAVSKLATEDRPGDESVLKESQNMTDVNLCAPDTLDFLQDIAVSSAPNVEDLKSFQVKEELTTENMIVSEGLVAELGLNLSSKSSDSESADQDIAKSMITLLLPQAVPLLEKASNRKQKKNNISRLSLPERRKGSQSDDVPVRLILNPQAVPLSMKVCNVDDEHSHNVSPDSDTDFRDPDIKSIIPDSFDESQLDIVWSDHIMSSPPKEAYPACLNRPPSSKEQVSKPNVKVSVSDLETNKSKDFSSYHDLHTVSDPNILKEHMNKSVSVPHRTISTKRRSTQESQEVCPDAGGKLLQKEHSENKDSKNKLDSVEGKGTVANATPSEVDSIKQEKHKVYTRRRFPTCHLQRNGNLSSESDLLEAGIGHEEQQSQSFVLAKMDDKCTNLTNNTESQSRRSVHDISTSSFPSPKPENIQTIEFPAGVDVKLHKDIKINNELAKTVELLGSYFLPMPISSILLKSVEGEIYVCVVSCLTTDRFRTLFVYKIAAKEPMKGCPSLIGHTPVILPFEEDRSGRNEALERSCLHFTPNGQDLILCGDIRTPCCREGRTDCLCLTCTSAGFEENAIRIVQVTLGHVSLVTKLQAVENVQCMVVCDPSYLVAVGKSGKLMVWVMDSSWRVPVKEFIVPINPCISSCIVELKQIPKCPYLVVGHNGVGEFTIWDISKRILVSRFSSPNNSIFEFIPISLFAWHPISSHSTMEDHIEGILAATKLWFPKHVDVNALVPTEGKDAAVWILVSTASDNGEIPARCWRLALLMKDAVIYGHQLDPRASAAGAMSGHGILGTHDGLIYLWDLSTGSKLGSLHNFEGHRVSCISTDDSTPGKLCIASDEGQLLVYHHQ